MSNSSLINYTMLSPNYSTRTMPISKLTPHHAAVVGVDSKRIASIFANKSRGASCNYAIGVKGDITLVVPEEYRAWTSGTWTEEGTDNDGIAVTFEIANDGGAPDWHVSDASIESLIKLSVDICQRNNIPRINFTGDANGNLTQHNYFQATACPGPYLKSKFPYIADEINKRLNNSTSSEMYRIRLTWENAKSQIGAYRNKDSAISIAKENPGYSVFDSKGAIVYDGSIKEEPKIEELYRVRKSWEDAKSQLGAFKNLEGAISVAKANPGYNVYDSNGDIKYESKITESPKEEPKEEPKTEPDVTVAVYDLDYPEKTLIVDRTITRTNKDCVKAIKKILENNKDFDIEIAKSFFKLAPIYGIDPLMAISQSILETGWFKYQGSAVKPEHHNYCGLGVTSNGIEGGKFDTIDDGVTAQYQHLYAYGTKDALDPNEKIIDPRFKYVTRGIAPYWQNLAGRWAVPGYDKNVYSTPKAAMDAGNTYGQKIDKIFDSIINTTCTQKDLETYFEKEAIIPDIKDHELDVGKVNIVLELLEKILKFFINLFKIDKE